MLLRLWRALQMPSPWLWCVGGRICQRLGTPQPARLPLEVLQQLHWWFIKPLRWRRRPPSAQTPLPWSLTFRACWLNSYRPSEVAWWWALGQRSWHQLSRHHPESLVGVLHAERRRGWPDQCRPALQLLSDKAALLVQRPGGRPIWCFLLRRTVPPLRNSRPLTGGGLPYGDRAWCSNPRGGMAAGL